MSKQTLQIENIELKSDADTNGQVWAWFTLNGKELVEFIDYEDYKCSVGLGQSNLKNCDCGLTDDEIDAIHHTINAYIRENEEAWAFLEEHEAMWEACRALTDIRPDYDEDAGSDILTFAVNGDDHSELLDSDGTLGRQSGDGSVKYRLDDDFSEAVRDAICGRLGEWVRENRRKRFSYEPKHSEIERIEHGLHISSGDTVVWLTEGAAERLNLDGNAYEITGDGSVSWRDRDYGDQYSENGAGGDTEENARKHMFAHPEAGIGEIENSIEFGNLSQLREDA